ncbi:MAG: hypothetical protein ACKOCX_11685 [Planctomycetota bacterium]
MPDGRRWRAASWPVAMLVAAVAVADELRPAWECLPSDTVAMVRLPRGAEFVEELRNATRFGAVALRADRLAGFWQMLVEQSERAGDAQAAGGLATWEESLEKYGLSSADLAAAFKGDAGAAVVLRPRDGRPPLGMLLAWAEPGEETAGRMLAAVRQRLAEVADETEGPVTRRIDLELAGHEVVSAVVPVMGLDMSDVDLEGLAEGEGDAAGDASGRIKRLQEKLLAAKPVQTGQTHAFHAVLGGRFLYGTTVPTAAAEEEQPDDLEAASGGDEAREIFGAFLAAHDGGGEAPLDRVLREPALAAGVPAGRLLVELVVVPRVLVAAAGGDAEELARWLREVGLDDVGGVAWRHAFDAGRWRATLAATMPAPRHGLLAMFDQPCDGCDVPPFVTREAIEFMQISLDLGKAFTAVRETLLAAGDNEQLANMFNVADVQATTWLGVDVATVLSGLGSRHWVVSFPPRIGAALAEARAAKAAGDAAIDLPGADSVAFVWEVADEEPLLKLLGRLAPMAGGQLQEEQGFRGLRVPGGAAFVGRNHLVLAVGEGTLEKVLSAIRNPPGDDLSWRESEALRRARQLVDMPAARMFGLSDSTRTGGGLGTLREMVAALEPEDVPESSRELLAAGQKLLPTAAEMEGMFGVGASVLRMTDDGPILESAWEMPAP